MWQHCNQEVVQQSSPGACRRVLCCTSLTVHTDSVKCMWRQRYQGSVQQSNPDTRGVADEFCAGRYTATHCALCCVHVSGTGRVFWMFASLQRLARFKKIGDGTGPLIVGTITSWISKDHNNTWTMVCATQQPLYLPHARERPALTDTQQHPQDKELCLVLHCRHTQQGEAADVNAGQCRGQLAAVFLGVTKHPPV